jgi:hypothetical protein
MGAKIGHVVSEETRDKISKSKLGKNTGTRVLSDDARRKMGDGRRGKKASPETLRKLSVSHTGIKQSDETKRRNSKSHQGYIPIAAIAAKRGIKLSRESKKRISKAKLGDKNPNWCGGLSFGKYCPKFNRLFKERVRARYNYTCMMCGHVWRDGEKRLTVHHVDYKKDSCCSENTKPLFACVCSGSCHSRTNVNREYWEKIFTDIINTKYGGICYLSEEEMESDLKNKKR